MQFVWAGPCVRYVACIYPPPPPFIGPACHVRVYYVCVCVLFTNSLNRSGEWLKRANKFDWKFHCSKIEKNREQNEREWKRPHELTNKFSNNVIFETMATANHAQVFAHTLSTVLQLYYNKLYGKTYTELYCLWFRLITIEENEKTDSGECTYIPKWSNKRMLGHKHTN